MAGGEEEEEGEAQGLARVLVSSSGACSTAISRSASYRDVLECIKGAPTSAGATQSSLSALFAPSKRSRRPSSATKHQPAEHAPTIEDGGISQRLLRLSRGQKSAGNLLGAGGALAPSLSFRRALTLAASQEAHSNYNTQSSRARYLSACLPPFLTSHARLTSLRPRPRRRMSLRLMHQIRPLRRVSMPIRRWRVHRVRLLLLLLRRARFRRR